MIESEPSDVALEFAKECMGWDEASPAPSGEKCIWKSTDSMRDLWYDDLNAVMAAVQGWVKSLHGNASFRLDYNSTYIGAVWAYAIGTATASAESDNPCYALLSACLAASRKLKARAV